LDFNGKTLTLEMELSPLRQSESDGAATLNIGGTGALTSTSLNFLSGSQSLSVLTMKPDQFGVR